MTITKSQTIVTASIIALALMLPAFSFAASPDVTKLQSQLQLLMERFESFKNNRQNNASSTAPATKPEKEKRASTTVNRTCMAEAVSVREASIKTAWTTYTGSMTNGLDTRSAALIAAWSDTTTNSKTANKAAWSTWKSDTKAAHSKLRTDRKSAWETFKKTAKDSCKVTVPKEEGQDKESKDSVAL